MALEPEEHHHHPVSDDDRAGTIHKTKKLSHSCFSARWIPNGTTVDGPPSQSRGSWQLRRHSEDKDPGLPGQATTR